MKWGQTNRHADTQSDIATTRSNRPSGPIRWKFLFDNFFQQTTVFPTVMLFKGHVNIAPRKKSRSIAIFNSTSWLGYLLVPPRLHMTHCIKYTPHILQCTSHVKKYINSITYCWTILENTNEKVRSKIPPITHHTLHIRHQTSAF